MEDRWRVEELRGVSATPWTLRSTDAPSSTDFGAETEKHAAIAEAPALVPRRLKITMTTLKEFGYTDQCRQCDHIRAFGEVKGGLAHSEPCRARIVTAMAATEKGAAKLKEVNERMDRALMEHMKQDDPAQAAVPPGVRPHEREDSCGERVAELCREWAEQRAIGPQVPPKAADLPGRPRRPKGTAVTSATPAATSASSRSRDARARQGAHAPVEDPPDGPMLAPASPHPRDCGVPRSDAYDANDADMDLIDDPDCQLMIMSLGAEVGPHRRERRTAARRMVSEVYSPPRVTRAISAMPSCGLVPGFALDLTCSDPDDGEPWDFDRSDKRSKARQLLRDQKPLVLVGSPMCTAWCTWQRLNALRRDGDLVRRELARARIHLDFVVSLYRE